ncbi:MAG: asparagine synthase (glutamine-hydrolyzing) [Candidatus Omnitrophota bacterium]
MCGICGKYYFDPSRRVEQGLLLKMMKKLYRRGPDEQGVIIEANAGLACQRLRIIDRLNGQQAVLNEDKTVWAVFNGEIYNYQELRNDLLNKGHVLKTKCDSEIIPHMFEEYGPAFVEKLNGMFAIAVYDRNQNTIILARDRTGIKPLYYALIGNALVFASSLKTLLVDKDIPKELDAVGLDYYFSHNFFPGEYTPVAKIKKLLPGHFLVCNSKEIKIKKYWELNYKQKSKKLKDIDYIKEFNSVFNAVVKSQLEAEVPVGLFLSGGIDSGGLAEYVSRLKTSLKTFSVGFQEGTFDERKYAGIIASQMETEHEHTVIPDSLPVLMERISDALDIPLGEGAFVPLFVLSEFAKKKVGVVLSGEGADELFGGYDTYIADILAEYFRKLPPVIRQKWLKSLVRRLPLDYRWMSVRFKLDLFSQGVQDRVQPAHYYWRLLWTPDEKSSLYSDIFSQKLRETGALAAADFFCRTYDYLGNRHYLEKAMFYDTKIVLPDDMLQKVDLASMYHSLEVRVPYLDNRIIDFSLGLPLSMKISKLKKKVFLKEAFKEYLPKQIIQRPKHGLSVPVEKWLRFDLHDFTGDVLSTANAGDENVINKKYLLKIFREHVQGAADHGRKLWNILMFRLWLDSCRKENLL